MTTTTIVPKRGLRFLHSRVLCSESFDGKTPQLYQVTSVTRGVAYYRPVYILRDGDSSRETFGAPACCAIPDFGRWVKEVREVAAATPGEG